MDAKQSFAIFQQAQKNLIGNPSSPVDQFVVQMWTASGKMLTESQKLAEDSKKLKVELLESQKTCADYCRQNDYLASKVAKLSGVSATATYSEDGVLTVQ